MNHMLNHLLPASMELTNWRGKVSQTAVKIGQLSSSGLGNGSGTGFDVRHGA